MSHPPTSTKDTPTYSVYIRQHPRFDGSLKHPFKAVILTGNLYGTPPASHMYFEALVEHLKQANYVQCQANPCLFVKQFPHTEETLLVCVSMDDFFTISPNPQYISDLFEHLSSKHKIKRFGRPQLYLKWQIIYSPNGSIHIFQPHTSTAILQKLQMFDCNPKHTPLPENPDNHLPSTPTAPSAHMATLFRQTISDIRYIADSTRPDIFQATNQLAAVIHNPTNTHLHKLKWLPRYVKHTLLHGILFKPQPTRPTHTLQTYSDADYANSQTENHTPVLFTCVELQSAGHLQNFSAISGSTGGEKGRK